METFSALLASEAELWCFLWSAPEPTVAQTLEVGDLRRHHAHHDVIVMVTDSILCYILLFVLIWTNGFSLFPGFSLLTCMDYSWWRHQMETLSALLAICAGNSPVPVNSPHKGQWRGALMFSLTCAWINDCVNNRKAGDLRRNRAHYGVIVMCVWVLFFACQFSNTFLCIEAIKMLYCIVLHCGTRQ